MAHEPTDPAWGTLLDLGERAAGPLHLRLVRALRAAVAEGRIAPGSALPPSRALAADLGCSRWVVTEAYGQLVAEGYFEARAGSATRVRTTAAAPAPPPYGRRHRHEPWKPEFDMLPGMPDLRAFPRKRWSDAVREATGSLTPAGAGRARVSVGSSTSNAPSTSSSCSTELTPTIGSTAGSAPISQERTTWLGLAPSSSATSRSTASRAGVPGWSYAGGSRLSARVYAPEMSDE